MFASIRPALATVFLALTAVPTLAQNVASVYYYSSTNVCAGAATRCANIPQLDCCEAPPSPTSFHLSRVIAAFSPCIQLFFNNDGNGGCAGCSSGGSCNTCYFIQNNPFTPALWFTTLSCGDRKRAVDDLALQGNSTSCHEVNEAVTADGRVFAIPPKASGKKEKFLEDFLALSPDEFHVAYNHSFLYVEEPLSAAVPAAIDPVHPVDVSSR